MSPTAHTGKSCWLPLGVDKKMRCSTNKSLLISMIKNTELTSINEEIVKLEMIDMSIRLQHIKNLIASGKGSLVLERIVCSNCLTLVNPLCEFVPVNTRNMKCGTKSYIIMEPQCPVCGAFITAEQFVRIVN